MLWERGQGALKTEEYDLAEEMFERLIQDYPDSEYNESARSALRKLNEDLADGED